MRLPFSLILIVAAVLQIPAGCRADSVNLLVPAYFDPGTGGPGGSGDGWAAMAAAASQTPVTAILNPNSGPVPGAADPAYVNALTNLEHAGGKAIGYIDTADGAISLSTVKAEMTTYIGQYGSLINGFFLDNMFVLPSTLSYYRNLNAYVKGQSSSYLLAGNPGQPFLNGASPSEYLSTGDLFDIFEGPNTAPSVGAAGFDQYPYGLNWFQSYSSSRFSNIIYDVSSASLMRDDLTRAMQLDAGFVYITDQGAAGGNPYAQLPSYWDQEVAAAAAAPEASSVAMVAAGSLFLCGGMLVRRRLARLSHT